MGIGDSVLEVPCCCWLIAPTKNADEALDRLMCGLRFYGFFVINHDGLHDITSVLLNRHFSVEHLTVWGAAVTNPTAYLPLPAIWLVVTRGWKVEGLRVNSSRYHKSHMHTGTDEFLGAAQTLICVLSISFSSPVTSKHMIKKLGALTKYQICLSLSRWIVLTSSLGVCWSITTALLIDRVRVLSTTSTKSLYSRRLSSKLSCRPGTMQSGREEIEALRRELGKANELIQEYKERLSQAEERIAIQSCWIEYLQQKHRAKDESAIANVPKQQQTKPKETGQQDLAAVGEVDAVEANKAVAVTPMTERYERDSTSCVRRLRKLRGTNKLHCFIPLEDCGSWESPESEPIQKTQLASNFCCFRYPPHRENSNSEDHTTFLESDASRGDKADCLRPLVNSTSAGREMGRRSQRNQALRSISCVLPHNGR